MNRSTEDLIFLTNTEEERRVRIGVQLPRAKKEEVRALLSEFLHLFIGAEQPVPQTVLNEHKIDLKESLKPKAHKF